MSADHFERVAVRRLIEDILAEQATIAGAVMRASRAERASNAESTQALVAAWASDPGRSEQAETARRTLDEVEQSAGGWSFAKLTIANSALRELASAVR